VNYLSHHAVALAGSGLHAPEFFVGNVLPDLLAMSRDGRVRSLQTKEDDSPLLQGVHLHLRTDKRFHAGAAFAGARETAKSLLGGGHYDVPLHRVFFLTHAFVEIALDGYLLSGDETVADDFYGRFAHADLPGVVAQAGTMLAAAYPLLGLARVLERFVEHRFLYNYADAAGRAEALHRLCLRAGLPGFASDDDRATLARAFAGFETYIGENARALLFGEAPPPAMVQ
jgi:hypothetical protein